MAKNSSSFLLYGGAVVVVVVLIAFVAMKKTASADYAPFAQCLTDKGAKMFGAWWCPHCANQKAEFEGAFSKVNYTECSDPGSHDMNQTCKDAKIEGFPTWEFADGSRKSGEIPLIDLADKTGCELPK